MIVFLRFCLFIYLFLERQRGGEREGETVLWERNISGLSLLTHPSQGSRSPGMCPDWKSNRRPFALQSNTKPAEPDQSGHIVIILHTRPKLQVGPGHLARKGRMESRWFGLEACVLSRARPSKRAVLTHCQKTPQFDSECYFVIMWKHSGFDPTPFSVPVPHPVLWHRLLN